MKRSTDRILTTHVGSLPRPKDLVELYRENSPDSTLLPRLRSAVAEVVQQQARCGIDVVNDGEFGKAMRRSRRFRRVVVLHLRPHGRLRAQRRGGEKRTRGVDVRQQGTKGIRRILC